MEIKVTIGLCVKNAEQTVKRAIESAIKQEFPHELVEIIVVDDGCKDKTLSIIEGCTSKTDIRVKIYHTEEEGGLGVARQTVIDNACGEYIVWLDGDMTLSKDYLQKQVKFMEQNPRIGVIKPVVWTLMDPSNKGTFVQNFEYMSKLVRFFKDRKKAPKCFGLGGCIFRLKAIREVGGFDRCIKGAAEDLDITTRISAAGWLLTLKPVKFYPHARATWKSLWDQYFWYGYGAHYVNHKHKGLHTLWHQIPPVGFVRGLLLYSFSAYKLTKRKASFLLPFQFTYKNLAWCLGFVRGHIDGYGHFHTCAYRHKEKTSDRQ